MPFPSLYFDESYAEKPVLTALRNESFDVKSFDEAHMVEVSDEEQLEFAVSEERILFSFNREDFHISTFDPTIRKIQAFDFFRFFLLG